ncbi:hypothetical protein RUM44_000993 [Polyplax serrata]|uniref:Senescence domain-containing protein n=1 Tax=Polyplax serrata TaxID=468196 RepID=A0ABR1B970_POLSC
MTDQLSKEISNEGSLSLFNELEKEYNEVYNNINEAHKLDNRGESSDALQLYELGLCQIDKALGISISEPSADLVWEKALAMTQKLKTTRKEILIRIESIKSKPKVKASELPTSYDTETAQQGLKTESNGMSDNGNNLQLPGSCKTDVPYISPSMIHDPLLLANLHNKMSDYSEVQNSDGNEQEGDVKLAKNEEILFHCDNVMLYFISPDGRVSSTSGPNVLIIARLYVDSEEKTFLQVGSFVYPLIPEMSPCIRAGQGTFILPDTTSEEGAAIGLVVENAEAEKEIHELLNTILNDIGVSRRTKRHAAGGYSSTLVRGATYLATNLVRSAGSTARFFDTSAPILIDKISPATVPKEINPNVQKTVKIAKDYSEKALDATEYLASKLGLATSALGKYLSPFIQKQGSKLLASTTNMEEKEASRKITSTLHAASNVAEGISIIYGGLETAASILARSLCNNTVQIVEYKYGEEAGALTNNALTTVGNMYHTQRNIKIFKPKGFTKAALRGAGHAMLEDWRDSKIDSNSQEEFQGSGPGAGTGV